MEILNLGNNGEDAPVSKSPRAKKLKVAKAAVGIGTIASLAGLGSTLAANISLNGNANVEFGQGVAQTAACDEDGFTITPVSYYDSVSSNFRLDYVSVSGLNLTPMGTNYESDPDASYMGITSAIAAHPGQYFDTDTNVWTNTCDQVVLDFKAYTDDVTYQTNTVDGFNAVYEEVPLPNTVTSPLMWQVVDYGNGTHGGVVGNMPINQPRAVNDNFAMIFDTTNERSNYAVDNITHSDVYEWDYTIPDAYNANSSFTFFSYFGHHSVETYRRSSGYGEWRDPAAGAIAKITVESMKYFPSSYLNHDQQDKYHATPGGGNWGDFGYYFLGSQYIPD